ncbi:MAG: tetratricopeptide repeat protein [Alphaproteobacteria bacterium]
MTRSILAAGLAAVPTVAAVTVAALLQEGPGPFGRQAFAQTAPSAAYVGRETCAACHQDKHDAWLDSHHDLAMQNASKDTVLGDFDDASATHFGITSRFTNRDGRFFVETEGPTGGIEEYEVAFVFGVDPVQQYLIPFPGGRFQALRVAWDSRPGEEGGQRWIHLDEGDRVPPGDPLHWTGRDYTWNYMCADCHSTNVVRAYDLGTDTYETTYSEIDVSCEACHGPGSRHVGWAHGGSSAGDDKGFAVRFDAPREWVMDPETGIAALAGTRPSDTEIQVCARCHSRRATLADGHEPGQPLLDAYRLSLLRGDLYHADGQILDEVFVHGSFLQSRMHAAGVRCTDCHDPHSLALRAPGNAVCARCHLPARFDTPDHHFHPAGTAGAECVSCHMPARNYLVVDARRDHSFRVPRPHLSVRLGTPNACTRCHTDESDDWAASAVERWYDAAPKPHYATAIHAGRNGLPGAESALLGVAGDDRAPGIVRGTALALMQSYLGPRNLRTVANASNDPDPLVRLGALAALGAAPPEARAGLVAQLLRDPVRAVRVEAARVMAPVPVQRLSPDVRASLNEASEEFMAAQMASAERPSAHLNLGNFHGERGQLLEAEAAYRTALRIEPRFTPAMLNFADLLRAQGRDNEGERILREAASVDPENGDVQHALGLLLVRQRRLSEALEPLAQATELEPENARYAYVHGVALDNFGDRDGAITALAAAHERHPGNRNILEALVDFASEAGQLEAARIYAERLVELDPRDRRARELLRAVEVIMRRP